MRPTAVGTYVGPEAQSEVTVDDVGEGGTDKGGQGPIVIHFDFDFETVGGESQESR